MALEKDMTGFDLLDSLPLKGKSFRTIFMSDSLDHVLGAHEYDHAGFLLKPPNLLLFKKMVKRALQKTEDSDPLHKRPRGNP